MSYYKNVSYTRLLQDYKMQLMGESQSWEDYVQHGTNNVANLLTQTACSRSEESIQIVLYNNRFSSMSQIQRIQDTS